MSKRLAGLDDLEYREELRVVPSPRHPDAGLWQCWCVRKGSSELIGRVHLFAVRPSEFGAAAGFFKHEALARQALDEQRRERA